MGRLEHVSFERTAEKTAKDPQQVRFDCSWSIVELRDSVVHLDDELMLGGEHAAPDHTILQSVLFHKVVDFNTDFLGLGFHVD